MIPTKKAYALLSLEKFNEEKQAYLNSVLPSYAQLSTEEKWQRIINHYHETDPELNRATLETFRDRSKNALSNAYNLSLASCLSYFENFCFLANTTHSHFKLSEDQKLRLQTTIRDALTTCETGKNARFHEILQLFRNDETHWVTKLLSDQRYHLLLELQENYNATFHVRNTIAIHTLDIITKLAEKAQLGVKIEHAIEDVYLDHLDYPQIKQYFERHYTRLFREYEDQIVESLSLHILFEISSSYDPKSHSPLEQKANEGSWETNQTLAIPADRVQEFATFIENRLGFKYDTNGQDIIYLLGELKTKHEFDNDHDVNTQYEFELVNKQAFSSILSSLIKQKLLKEEYFLDLKQLTDDKLSSYKKLTNEKHHKLLAIALEGKKLLDKFVPENSKNSKEIIKFIHNNQDLIVQYPDIILDHLQDNPALFALLPTKLKSNALFIDATIDVFNGLLTKTFQQEDEATFNKVAFDLVRLIQGNAACFRKLSPALQQNENLALELLKANASFFREFPLSIRQNQRIADQALAQNCFAFLYLPSELRPFYPDAEQIIRESFFRIVEEPIHKIVEETRSMAPLYTSPRDDQGVLITLKNLPTDLILGEFTQAHAIYQLLTQDNLSIIMIAKLTENLTPAQLIKIVEWRQKNDKVPLACCHTLSTLKKFNQKLSAQGIQNWSKDHGSVRQEWSRHFYYHPKKAYLREEPIAFLANTESWFIAFASYQYLTQGAFKSSRQFWQQLAKTIKSFLRLLLRLFMILSTVTAGFFLAGLITTVLQANPWLLVGLSAIGLAAFAVASLVKNPRIAHVAINVSLLCGMFFLNNIAIISMGFFMLAAMNANLPSHLMTWVQDSSTLIKRSLKVFCSDSTNTLNISTSLIQTCENRISALTIQGDRASAEQAMLLGTIWSKIKVDLANLRKKGSGNGIDNDRNIDIEEKENTEDILLKPLLDKPYTIFYLHKTHRISFNALAALKQRGDHTFDMPKHITASSHAMFSNAPAHPPTTAAAAPKQEMLSQNTFFSQPSMSTQINTGNNIRDRSLATVNPTYT